MDDDRLAEGGGDDVKMSLERWEDIAIGDCADWVEPEFFADQGNSSADDDAAGGEQSDHLGEGEGERGAGCCQDGGRIGVACRGGFGDDCGGDGLRFDAGPVADGPFGLLLRRFR